jgi:hypothetical protein
VRQLLVTDPATREFDKLQNYLDDRVRPEIQGAVDALNARDAAPAEGQLQAHIDRFEAELSNLPDLIKDCLAALTRSG